MKFRIPNIILITCLTTSSLIMNTNRIFGDGFKPRVGIDSVGNSVVVWENRGGGSENSIKVSNNLIGSGWSIPIELSIPNPFTTPPVIGVDSNNNAVAVWSVADESSGMEFLYASMLVSGSSLGWSPPIQISPSTTSVSNDYVISINQTKSVIVAWSAYDATLTHSNVWVAKAKIGGAWSPAEQISH